MPTLSKLKSHLLSLYRPAMKSIFGIHDPEGLRLLFQLRLGLSPLRHHKKDNFLDTFSDICLCKIGSETTEHFLFKCPFYASKRAALAERVVPLLPPHGLAFLQNDVKLYLYGHEDLSEIDNRTILLETITFIKSTCRFTWAYPPPPFSFPNPLPFLDTLIVSITFTVNISHYMFFMLLCVLYSHFYFLNCVNLECKPDDGWIICNVRIFTRIIQEKKYIDKKK